MKRLTIRIFLAALSGLFIVISGVAQDKEAVSAAAGSFYVVSAKAGGVSYVEGDVSVLRADGGSGRLWKGEFVEIGDKVTTGENGRAEIMMNPGSFIRLNRNTAFSFETTSLEDLRINLISGTAIFEVFASDDFKVTVNAAGSKFYLVKSGVYRVDVGSSNFAKLEVWKGKAQAGDLEATKISKGRAARALDGAYSITRFSDDMDDFEVWSKERAKEIAQANRSFAQRNLGNAVLQSYRNYSWNCADSLGLWVFTRRYGVYSFLPFGYGWRSPYGFRLGSNTSICNYPSYYWRRPMIPDFDGGGRKGGGGTGGGSGSTSDDAPIRNPKSRIDRPGGGGSVPPFQKMEQSRGVRRVKSLDPPGDFDYIPRQPRPSSTSPAPRSTTPTSAPATKPIRKTKGQLN